MSLCLKAQFSLRILLPDYYSTKAGGGIPADSNGNRSKPSSLNRVRGVIYSDPPRCELISSESIKVSQA